MDLLIAKERAATLLGEAREPTREAALVEVGRREGVGKGFIEQLQSMTPQGFPIPDLVVFGFTRLLGLGTYGPEEKLRWGVAFEFRGAVFAFELRKFGLRLLCEKGNLDSPLVGEVLGRTRGLTDVVERYLAEELVPKALDSGAVTVPNLYSQLSQRFSFLRASALEAYSKPAPTPKKTVDESGTITTQYFTGAPRREGSALATAAVDAYYSRSEHFFVLAAAMREAPLPSGGLRAVLQASWIERARMLLDLNDPPTKKRYDRLLDIRESWRNPLAHGGFHAGHASLFFHVRGLGALPFRLRRTPRGVEAAFTLQEESFKSLLEIFDDFDSSLSAGPLRFAKQWAEAGLDVAFDERSLRDYRSAMQSDVVFAQYIDYQQAQADMHANMEY